jgi:hypothetical protein
MPRQAIFDKSLWPVWCEHSCPRNRKMALAGNLWLFLLFVASLAVPSEAQRTATTAAFAQAASPARPSTSPINTRHANSAFGRSPHASGFRHSPFAYTPYASLPFPFFGDSFNPDDIYSTGYPVASPPPPYVLEAARALAAAPASMSVASAYDNNREPSSSQPLMIELQNGRYVRVKAAAIENSEDGEAQELTPEQFQRRSLAPASQIASKAPSLPPAVLVFCDGHSEEVRDYTIADGILYARGDFYSDGYWNKKIALSTLNVGQTLQANAARNVNFVLPASPNEVITRP